MKRSSLKRSRKSMKRSVFGKKTGKKKTVSRIILTKRAKSRVWKLARKLVIRRDGGIDVVTGEENPSGGIHVHHWIVYDGACARTRYLLDNLVSLSYVSHHIKIHLQGDAETYDKMRSYMIGLIGLDRYEEIKAMKHLPVVQRKLEDYLELEEEFEMMLRS